MLLTHEKEDPQKPVPLSVVRVIDTQTEEGMREARAVTQGIERSPASVAASVHAVRTEEEKPVSTAQERMEEPVKPERQTAEQHAAFSSFVTQYFGGAALRETGISGVKPENMEFAKLPAAEEKSAALAEKRPVSGTSETATPNQKEDTPVVKKELSPVMPREEEQKEPEQQTILAPEKKDELGEALRGYQMIGVAFDTYIMLQNDKQMLFIDQHAAHERILYERLMREIDQGAGSQVLMVPQIVHVTPQDAAKIENYAQEIRAAGFDIEPFGDHAYTIRAVPNVLGVPQTKAAFLDMVDRLGELRVLSTQQKRRDAILQMACKKAIKGGDRLTMEEIKPLLMDMIRTNAPPTCPHGRPLVITLSRNELEKRFRRIND